MTPRSSATASACRISSARRDADVAFGLAYAHAEDDFPTIQRALLSARGKLGHRRWCTGGGRRLFRAAPWDLGCDQRPLRDGSLARDPRAARRLRRRVSIFMRRNTGARCCRVSRRQKPQDIVALFMLRLPFLYGLDSQLRALFAGNRAKDSRRYVPAARACRRGRTTRIRPTARRGC